MTTSPHFVDELIRFAESGNQHKIICQTPSGKPTEYQGWIMEINDNHLVISIGFADKNSKEVSILFEQLQQAELYFWNPLHDKWQQFIIND